MSGSAYCPWCGRPGRDCDGLSCRPELQPPHFCPSCGRRMRVQVTPTGWSASCRDHGVPDPSFIAAP